MSCGEMFYMTVVSTRVMRNVEQNCSVEKFHHMRDLSTGAMQNVENICYVEKLSCFVAKSVLLQFSLFCRGICYDAIYALLCGEKFNQKLCLWRKKTNIRYGYGILKECHLKFCLTLHSA